MHSDALEAFRVLLIWGDECCFLMVVLTPASEAFLLVLPVCQKQAALSSVMNPSSGWHEQGQQVDVHCFLLCSQSCGRAWVAELAEPVFEILCVSCGAWPASWASLFLLSRPTSA